MKRFLICFLGCSLLLACSKELTKEDENESTISDAHLRKSPPPLFAEIGSITLPGGTGAAEISAYDSQTQRLFVVNNSAGNNRIDVVNLSNPVLPVLETSISTAIYGGMVNSVSVNSGLLAAAIEANDKVSKGKVVVFRTNTLAKMEEIVVGSLPDMVTFSPDGRYILTANEGEPNADYTIDPEGSISIIEVENGFAVTTLNFTGFASQQADLEAKGLRIFGPGASFAQDIEPEYIAVAANSQTAWVTLQENNAVAKLDISSKTITTIFPLGFKSYTFPQNAMDLSDRDNTVTFNPWPVYGMYQPDAIAVLPGNNVPFIFTANEGDAREYNSFIEDKRTGSLKLDPTIFPNAAELLKDKNLGRLNVSTKMGDLDGDGDFDVLYSHGARSFSIWNGNTGNQVYDSGNELDRLASQNNVYPDIRSDDKGAEPEGIAIGRSGNRNLLFVGLERANSLAVYDVTNPVKPVYLQWLATGSGPEGVTFVSEENNPTGKSLLIVSSENDGKVKIYSTP